MNCLNEQKKKNTCKKNASIPFFPSYGQVLRKNVAQNYEIIIVVTGHNFRTNKP